jgi:hypothetical protein
LCAACPMKPVSDWDRKLERGTVELCGRLRNLLIWFLPFMAVGVFLDHQLSPASRCPFRPWPLAMKEKLDRCDHGMFIAILSHGFGCARFNS